MKQIELIRVATINGATYGVLVVIDNGNPAFSCPTIENAEKSFPDGDYDIVFEYSTRFNKHLWELKGIPGRGEIKVHAANYYNQLEGCIGVGLSMSDINKDGVMDIAESGKALAKFHYYMAPDQSAKISVTSL